MARNTDEDGPDDFTLPADYEPCGECGFDHAYEFVSATAAHWAIDRELAKNDKGKPRRAAA